MNSRFSFAALCSAALFLACNDDPPADTRDGDPPSDYVIDVVADTFMHEGHPTDARGVETTTEVQSGPHSRILIRADERVGKALLRRGGTVEAAQLELNVNYASNNWGDGGILGLHALTRDWDEDSATFRCPDDQDTSNQQDDCNDGWDLSSGGDNPWDPQPIATAEITKGMTGTVRFDVTHSYASILAGANNFGWVILRAESGGNNGTIHFDAREGGVPPRLLLDIEQPPRGRIQGRLVKVDGSPIKQATVKAALKEATTDDDGRFILDDLAETEKLDIVAEKDGITSVHRKVAVREAEITAVKLIAKETEIKTVNVDSGTIVETDDGVMLELPQAGFVDEMGAPVEGDVELETTVLNTPEEILAAPGDMLADVGGGEEVPLESFGMAELKFTKDGKDIELAPGATALVSIPLTPGHKFLDGQQVGLFGFDEELGVWVQEGLGTVSGDEFIAEVKHFSWWNCDQPIWRTGCINGQLLDGGVPLANVDIQIQGIDYNGVNHKRTDVNGQFCGEGLGGANVRIAVYGAQSGKAFDWFSEPIKLPEVAECGGPDCDTLAALEIESQTISCGDSVIDFGEECDPPDGSTCDATCQVVPDCGNGWVDAGEECDGGGVATNRCTIDCNLIVGCGNFQVEGWLGETCEPPNTSICDADCHRIPGCGDGILDAGEECESTALPTAWCDSNCEYIHTCGDGNRELGETCDELALPTPWCNTDCEYQSFCGNTKLDFPEACDPPDPGAFCDTDCTLLPGCGNGIIDGDEECDIPGSTLCTVLCTRAPTCGNSVLNGDETCDDGNIVDGDGCSSLCECEDVGGTQFIQRDPSHVSSTSREPTKTSSGGGGVPPVECPFTSRCGDGTTEAYEQCDPPGTWCTPECRLIPGCGNGVVEFDEYCDPGIDDPMWCDANCEWITGCGNGIVDVGLGEQCDLGDTPDATLCDPTSCTLAGLCGNSIQDPGETCDDGNVVPGDACDETCQCEVLPATPAFDKLTAWESSNASEPNPFVACPFTSTCGNGILEAFEECDDGNRDVGDGCDDLCRCDREVDADPLIGNMNERSAGVCCGFEIMAKNPSTQISTEPGTASFTGFGCCIPRSTFASQDPSGRVTSEAPQLDAFACCPVYSALDTNGWLTSEAPELADNQSCI